MCVKREHFTLDFPNEDTKPHRFTFSAYHPTAFALFSAPSTKPKSALLTPLQMQRFKENTRTFKSLWASLTMTRRCLISTCYLDDRVEEVYFSAAPSTPWPKVRLFAARYRGHAVRRHRSSHTEHLGRSRTIHSLSTASSLNLS